MVKSIAILAAVCASAACAYAVEDTPAASAPAPTDGETNLVQSVERPAKRPAKINSDRTYYDRKEGFAVFKGNVHVDDEEYQMHTDQAYVFMDGTNQLRRIVAMGHVAITNGLKQAYGIKASYYRETGMVVLYGDATCAAEVRDISKPQAQVVKGSKIKFWTGTEQVEVLDARITAPTQGSGLNAASLLGR